MRLLNYRHLWWGGGNYGTNKRTMLLEPTVERKLYQNYFSYKSILHNFVFTCENRFYTHSDYKIAPMQETMEHRMIRSKKRQSLITDISNNTDEILEVSVRPFAIALHIKLK
jgi:hypothetical protein